MKVNVELESEDIKDIHDMIHDWMALDLTEEQIKTLMANEKDILMDMAQYGVSDTPTREALMQAIGVRLTKKPYPKPPCDKAVRDAYYKEIIDKAKEHGIKVVEALLK